MTIVELHKKFYTVPTCWNELSQNQLLLVTETLLLKEYMPEQILLKLLKILLNFNHYQFFKTKVEELEEYIYLVAFLFQNENGLTKNLLPSYAVKTVLQRNEVRLYGPDDEFNNLRMNEFVFSEEYFMRWSENNKDEDLLNEFIAVLYRPAKKDYDFEKNPDGDPRSPFIPTVSAYYARKIIKDWPKQVKLAIATWYSSCRQQLVAGNPDVFGGEGEPAKYGLLNVMRNVAKDGAFGDFEKVEHEYVNLVMIELNIVCEEAKKIKAAHKL